MSTAQIVELVCCFAPLLKRHLRLLLVQQFITGTHQASVIAPVRQAHLHVPQPRLSHPDKDLVFQHSPQYFPVEKPDVS
jgi:hypothetical protein